MADVTLAEMDGQVWLVGGVEHIDALLMGVLEEGITTEFVSCTTRAEVWDMWFETNPEARATNGTPWVIHPAIVRRIKGTLDRQCIQFTAWSAMMAEEAQAVAVASAEWLKAHADGRLLLRQYTPPGTPPGLADLQRLRGQLVAGALAREGADPERLDHETQASENPDDAERLDIVTISPPAIA